MSLWDAWREWASGNPTSGIELWGVEMIWWGRIGKALQLVGALTVIFEIVGTERLRAFGESLRAMAPFQGMVDRVADRWRPVWMWVRTRAGRATAVSRGAATAPGQLLRTAAVWQLVGRLVLAAIFVLVALLAASWAWIFVLVALLGGLALLGATLLLSVLGWLVATAVVRPFAWMVSVPALDAWAKTAGVAFVVVGFHFDLLAS